VVGVFPKEGGSRSFLDIDDFKLFNARYPATPKGESGKSLRNTNKTRSSRYGGEEFVVLLPTRLNRRLKRAPAAFKTTCKKCRCAREREPITVSIGIASLPEDTKDRHQLLLFADKPCTRRKVPARIRAVFGSGRGTQLCRRQLSLNSCNSLTNSPLRAGLGRGIEKLCIQIGATAGGECMQAVRSPRLYTASVFLTAAAALGASIVFYDGIPWERWPNFWCFLILNIYFHCFPATVGENRGYSLWFSCPFCSSRFNGYHACRNFGVGRRLG